MEHQTAFELLPLLSLDALEATESQEIEQHVLGCRACRSELNRYEAVAEALAGEMEPSPETWERIKARIDAG